MPTLTESIQYVDGGIVVDGKLYKYRAGPFDRRKRKKRGVLIPIPETLLSYTVNETTKSVTWMPNIVGLADVQEHMRSSCVRCNDVALSRFIFDARTQQALKPLRKLVKSMHRLHVHGPTISIELAYRVRATEVYATVITNGWIDPRKAVKSALEFIDICRASQIPLAGLESDIPCKSSDAEP